MSTRFYYGQKDYIEQLNAMDDVATASATSAAASATAAANSAAEAAASAAAAASLIEDQIVDGQTTKAPSQNAVYDALALKAPINNPSFTGTVSGVTKAMVGLGNVDNTSDANKPVSTAQAAADAATLASANSYADGLVVSMWDDRGNYDASSNTFPTTGGSGSAGAVKKNDIWTISVAGTLGGTPVAVRQFIRALIDTPGQTSTNWAIGLANTDIDDSITDGVTGRAPSQNAVFDALALKAPLASPPLTGTPTAPTASAGTNTTQLATTAFVQGEKASPTLTGTTTVDNLTFSGVLRRILGDFTNATHSNRVLFQSSTANSTSTVGVMPSGTGTTGQWTAYNNSNPDAASQMLVGVNATSSYISSSATGAGSILPLTLNTGGVERMRVNATSPLLQVSSDSGTFNNRFGIQDVTTNSPTSLEVIPNGTGPHAQLRLYNNSDRTNCSAIIVKSDAAAATILSGSSGSGAIKPLTMVVGATEMSRMDTTGDMSLFGGAIESNGAAYRTLSLGSGTTGSAGTVISLKDSSGNSRGSLASNTGAGLQLQSVSAGLPMLFFMQGTERMRLSGTANRLQADMSNATLSSRFMFQTSVANSGTSVGAAPNGTGVVTNYNAFASSDADNSSYVQMGINSGSATTYISSAKTGTGTDLPLVINVGGTERARFDTAGSFIAAGTIVAATTSNLKIHLRDGVGTSRGFLSADSANCFGVINAENTSYTLVVANTGNMYPGSFDNTTDLGRAANRWRTVYAGTGTINTSDAREKTEIVDLSDAEVNAAKDLSKLIGTYKWLESIKEKGDNARTHIGLTVQQAIKVMKSHGLDPMSYAFICYDEWEEQAEVKDEKGNISVPYRAAGSRYGFRYDQLNIFIARGLEARIAALEAAKT